MNEPYRNNGSPPAPVSDTTTDFPSPNPRSRSPARVQCNLALAGSTGKMYAQEIACLLRYRLRIAAVIFAAGFSLFFLRSVFGAASFLGLDAWDRAWQGVGAAVLVLVATLLSSHIRLSVPRLRAVEMVLFGVVTLYFAWIQYVLFQDGSLLVWANTSTPESTGNFLRIANAGNILRWFALIVMYGTFVPNTWKRSALYVGLLAAVPLVLTSLMCMFCPKIGPHAFNTLLDTVTLLGVAAAIAIFGSYKISELQKEAIQAKRLGQYQLKELIGKGGMGEVHLGEHHMLRRKCAIKLIRPDHSDDATTLSRFEREVKAMASLTHWNNVEVYDYGLSEDGTFYYVMEYLPGLSLQELVDRHGPLSPARAVYFLRQICDALHEAHGIGLIHRDIKPSNVIACERGGIHDVVKLLDFGLVQCLGIESNESRLTMQGVVLGSPPYMSPEQALGKANLDGRTDIYSLGGLAYFLLTGHPIYDKGTPMQILMAHVYEPIPSLAEARPDVPRDLEEIIMKCLNKEPKDRYDDVESLEEALAQCASANDWTRKDAANWWRNRDREKQAVAAIAG
jgi:tRNA A-37 threonylcarbamoyl transferase component Bud32